MPSSLPGRHHLDGDLVLETVSVAMLSGVGVENGVGIVNLSLCRSRLMKMGNEASCGRNADTLDV